MAREKKLRNRKPLPEDVLEGRVKVDALELYRLIHRVNPTNRVLSRREAARRYEVKHRLQSFLVLRYGDDHVVVSRSDKEGVVRFDHPSGIFDACHAPLAELDPEARSWIQRRLDMEGGDDDELTLRLQTSVDAAGEAPEDVLTAARRSVAEFDYAKAERLLNEALDAGDRSVELAVELLSLQVETLGLDEDALALYPRLGDAALADVDLRSLLALAAARQGRSELAEKLLAGQPHGPGQPGSATSQKRRTAAFAARAAGAVRAGDEEAARRWLGELVDRDPFHEEIAAVRAGLEQLAEAGMKEAEAELDALYRERGALEAADEARTLADCWPASEVARRVLREAGELRRRAAVAEHLEIAGRALAAEEFNAAVRHYEAALAEAEDLAEDEDLDVPGIRRRLEQARRNARQRAEESAVGDVEKRFAEDDPRRALLAYLELPEALRPTLRSRLEDRETLAAVRDLDAVAAARTKLKAAAAVDAVLALGGAEKLFAEDRAEEAWVALETHQDVLAAVPRTSSLRVEVVKRLVDGFVEKNYGLIQKVEESVKNSTSIPELESCLRLLDRIEPKFLSPKYRRWVEKARTSTRQLMALFHLSETFRSELEAGHIFAARETLRRYRETETSLDPKTDPEAWARQDRMLDERIKVLWQVKHERWRRGKTLTPYPGLLQPRPGQGWRSVSCSLDDEGRRLVVAQAFVDWLFVTVVEVDRCTVFERGNVVERLSMNTPKPLGAPLSTCWDGDAIRIGGGGGGHLVLEPEGWRIAEWEWLPGHLVKEDVERTVVLPRSPYVWVFSRGGEAVGQKVQVLARDGWKVVRKRTWVLAASVLYGLSAGGSDEETPPPRVLVTGKTGTSLLTARGQRDPDRLLVDRYALAAAADGAGIVALLTSPPEHLEKTVDTPATGRSADARSADVRSPKDDDGSLGLARLEPGPDGWRLAREVRLAAAAIGQVPVMVAAQGVVWAIFDGTDGESWLIAVEGETLEPLYQLRVPHAAALAGDRHGRHAVLLLDGDRGPEVVRLGRDEPRLRWKWRPLAERRFPIVDLDLTCMTRTGKGREALVEYDDMSRSQRRERLLDLARKSTAENLEEAILWAYVLHARDHDLARAFVFDLRKRHPENIDAVFLVADLLCRHASLTQSFEDWKEALEMVLGHDPGWITVWHRHFHHVLGVAYLMAGKIEEARETFEAGLAHDDGACDLEPLIELVKPMRKKPKASEWNAGQPLTRQLVGALRVSSAAIARDDDKAAVAALQRPAVWLAGETETLTRLSVAHIALAGDPEDAGFEARLALSYLLEVIHELAPRRIPSADLKNAAENLKNAEDGVRQWLGMVAEARARVREEQDHRGVSER